MQIDAPTLLKHITFLSVITPEQLFIYMCYAMTFNIAGMYIQ